MLIILGPTASGKTRLAVQAAHRLEGEIISVDSRQVYRDMDIGTGKDLDEYGVGDNRVPYHLIDIVEAGAEYNLFEFQKDFYRALADIAGRGKLPVVCGGTGLYLDAVLKGHQFTAIPIDETARRELDHQSDEELLELFNRTPSAYTPLADTSTRKRLIRAIEISRYLTLHPDAATTQVVELPPFVVVGLNPPVELRRERISRRLRERLQNGLVEEVEQLLKRGIPAEKLVFYGLEYKFITQYLTGQLTYEALVTGLETAIHQFAKRQMTYFRKMERDGLPIHWLDASRLTSELCEEVVGLWRHTALK